MPHLVRWNDELADFGLAVLGFHVQDASPDEVKRKSEALGISFPVLQGGDVPETKRQGIPHLYIFDGEGKLAFEGHPREAETALRKEVGRALVKSAKVTEPHPTLKKVIEELQSGKPPVPFVARVLPLRTSSDPKLKEQATSLSAALQAGGLQRLQEAKDGQKDDPVTSYDTAVRLATVFKSTPIAGQANELATKLRGDKRVAAELRARPMLESIKKLDATMAPALKAADGVTAEFKKAAATQLKQMSNQLAQLQRGYGETRAARQAAEIASRYEVK